MTTDQVFSLGPQLADFLGEFKGQLSDLPRKSVQPIADFNGTPCGTLQEFHDWAEHAFKFLVDRRLQPLLLADTGQSDKAVTKFFQDILMEGLWRFRLWNVSRTAAKPSVVELAGVKVGLGEHLTDEIRDSLYGG